MRLPRHLGFHSFTAVGLALGLVPAGAQVTTNRPARSLPVTLTPIAPVHPPAASVPPADATFQGIVRPLILTPSPQLEMASNILVFAREVESAWITNGAPEANYIFAFTNVGAAIITITNVALSCGCTTVDHPPLPWRLPPGAAARLPVTLEVAGRTGSVVKTVQLRTDQGCKTLVIRAEVQPPDRSE